MGQYPLAGMIALASIAFFTGATINDLWFDLGTWVKEYQTLITGMVALATVFAAFHQVEENRKERDADRRLSLKPRIEAIEAVEGFARRTTRYFLSPMVRDLGREAVLVPDTLMASAQTAGPDVAKRLLELKNALDRIAPPTDVHLSLTWRLPGSAVDDGPVMLACALTLEACRDQRRRLEQMALGHNVA